MDKKVQPGTLRKLITWRCPGKCDVPPVWNSSRTLAHCPNCGRRSFSRPENILAENGQYDGKAISEYDPYE